MHYQSNPCAPMMPHAQSLQVHLPDGTISGKINQNLPPIINTDISLPQFARYIHYSEEQMNIIDWANYRIASKSFTSTALSRAHACKSFNNLCYGFITTDPQAIDYPYPTTNTPPLTTHHALIICGSLRRVCPCDDYRDAKEDDCDPNVFVMLDQFSKK